ncbi:unnamed protein product [Brachionus calyciflorus]|uniref:Uncharacterized protein n=1 Tax=Brachionus calyciflorus TaxID=104777 RepID=A0A814Q7K1_9BILA|nr:unnamed protein product [Brachionus calyciflorus]
MSSSSARINFVPNSPDDPRCLSCKMQHCFQCEHKQISLPPVKRPPPIQPVYQASTEIPKEEEKKKKKCCCF